MLKNKQSKLLFGVYWLLLLVFSVFSYSLTAPNLTLVSWQPFVNFQSWMWSHFYNNRTLSAIIFTSLFFLLIGFYLKLVQTFNLKINIQQKPIWTLIKITAILGFPLMFAYNAFSYDIFNYMFNAKMVIQYQANPHLKTALDFAHDSWTRFMHNVHTPAPYGYGWTIFSLLPFLAGFKKFILTWFSFKLSSYLSLLLLIPIWHWLAQSFENLKLNWKNVLIFCFNPLILIELIGNGHNDLWMMLPVFVSFGLIPKLHKKSPLSKLLIGLGSAVLLVFSISTKLASLTIVPIWILLIIDSIKPKITKTIFEHLPISHKWWQQNWPLLASILMFIPLLTNRSQQFHPWYLTWALVWLPLIKNKTWKNLLLIFSFSSLFRYLPWILANDYSPYVKIQQKLITWLPALIWISAQTLTALLNHITPSDR
jgi:hypothetical protein